MSYSFSVKANTKAEIQDLVSAEFDKIVVSQPTHEADRQAAEDAVLGFLDVVRDPSENESVQVSVSGSLQWTDPAAKVFNGAGVNVSVYIAPSRVA